MGYFTSGLRALGTTFSTIFRKPVTAQFPFEIRPRPERFRVSFALPDDEHGELSCVGCYACEKICPSQVIKVKQSPKRESPVTGKKRAYADDFTLDLSACIFCELCIQVCPSDSIVMLRQPEKPTFAREDLVLTLAQLIENAKTRPIAWSNYSRLMEMQEGPPKEKPVKEKPAAAPAAAAAAPAATPVAAAPAAAAPTAAPVAAAPATAPVAAAPGASAATAAAPAAPPADAAGKGSA